MGKYRVLAPIGGHRSIVYRSQDVVSDEELPIPAADLIAQGFLQAIGDGEASQIEDSGKEKKDEFNIPIDETPKDEKKDDVKKDEIPAGDVEDPVVAEIKAELKYEGIEFPENATKNELFDIWKKATKKQ